MLFFWELIQQPLIDSVDSGYASYGVATSRIDLGDVLDASHQMQFNLHLDFAAHRCETMDFDLDLAADRAVVLEQQAHDVIHFYHGIHGLLPSVLEIPDHGRWKAATAHEKIDLIRGFRHASLTDLLEDLLTARGTKAQKRKRTILRTLRDKPREMRHELLCWNAAQWDYRRMLSRQLSEPASSPMSFSEIADGVQRLQRESPPPPPWQPGAGG